MPLTRDLVLQIRAINKASQSLAKVREQIEQIHVATQALNSGVAPSAKVMDRYSTSTKKAAKETGNLNAAVEKHVGVIKRADGGVQRITTMYDRLGKKTSKAGKNMVVYTKTIDQTTASMAKAGAQTNIFRQFINGLTNSTRVSAEGFGRMIANNATWLAGFALIGATIGGVIRLFDDLAQRQNEFVKVSRLVATAFEDENQRAIANVIAYQEFTRQLARTGRTIEDVAEAEYQLLSAGLSLKQVTEGLGPAMDLLDAAMDDVTQTTKLLAGIMNNFGNSMYRTSEGNIVFANSMRAIKENLQDNVTEFEKMSAVSNLLAVAFDKHQAEVNELRDGLKFSIPAAKAAGVGLDELSASLVTLEDHMIKSGRAGRSLRIMLTNIVKAPEKMQQAFRTAFDPKEVDPLVSFLQRAGKEFDKMPDKAEKIALAYEIFTTRGADAFLQLVTQGDKLAANLEELRQKGVNVAEVMAEVVRASPERQFRRLWNSIVNLVDSLGGKGLIKMTAEFAGILADTIQTIAEGVSWVERFVLAMKEYATIQAQAAEENDGWRSSIVEAFKQQIQAQDPISRLIKDSKELKAVLLGETWQMGAKDVNDWMDSVLFAKDAVEAKKEEIIANNKELDEYVANIGKAYENNQLLAESAAAVSNVMAGLEIGDQISRGLITAGEGARLLNNELETIAINAEMETLNANVNSFNILVGKSGATMEQFGRFTKEAISPALQGFEEAQKAVDQYTRELLDANHETNQLKITISQLGGANAAQLLQLGDALGLGASSAGSFLDEVNNLEPEIQKLRDEYAKLNSEGAEQSKLLDVWNQLTAAQDKQSKAMEKANNALAISIPLLQQRASSTQKTLALNDQFAEKQRLIAESTKNTAQIREQAAKREEQYIQDSISALQAQAQDRVKLSELSLKQREIGEYEHQQNVLQIYQETSGRIGTLQEQLGAAYERRVEIQKKKEEETADKIEESQRVLKDYNTILEDIAKVIKQVDLPKLAEGLKKPFEDSVGHVKDVNDELGTMLDSLNDAKEAADQLARSLEQVRAAQVSNQAAGATQVESEYYGGFAGYAPFTRVTAGEGFVSPDIAKRHRSALESINRGMAVPTNFPVQTFQGPGGIDNILTSLPAGSYVISKRGMETMERARSREKERTGYQMGGMISNAPVTGAESRAADEPMSRFELTLVVGNEQKSYPLYGPQLVVDEVRRTLERENMTKL